MELWKERLKEYVKFIRLLVVPSPLMKVNCKKMVVLLAERNNV